MRDRRWRRASIIVRLRFIVCWDLYGRRDNKVEVVCGPGFLQWISSYQLLVMALLAVACSCCCCGLIGRCES
jgi:hypothetical protein